MKTIQEHIDIYLSKYGKTIRWRTASHTLEAQSQLREGEVVSYAFVGKLNGDTAIFVITNERILISRKNLIGGGSISINLDTVQDIAEDKGAMYGSLNIQTVKGVYSITGVQKGAVPEIRNEILKVLKARRAEGDEVANETNRLLKKLINIQLTVAAKEGALTSEQVEEMIEK